MTPSSLVPVLSVVLFLVGGCERSTVAAASEGASPTEVTAERRSAENLQTAELMVEGTSCASCTVTIRRHLNKLAGVSEIREGQSKQHVMVDFDPEQVSPEQIVQAVHEAGYEAEVLVYAKKS